MKIKKLGLIFLLVVIVTVGGFVLLKGSGAKKQTDNSKIKIVSSNFASVNTLSFALWLV